MIELYEKTQRDFSNHGHVLQDVYNDTVTWKINETFTLQFDYPLTSPHGFELTREKIITVPVPSTFEHNQAFRIYDVKKSMGVATVYARHVFWDLMQNLIEDTNVVDKNGQLALDQILGGGNYASEFEATSNLANTATARIVRMSVVSALIGTDDNTFLKRWGGEFEWDNWTFRVADKIGADRGVVFSNKKNLLGYTAEDNTDTVITRIMPEGYNGLFLPEKYVDSPLINNYLSPRVAVVPFTDIKAIDENTASDDEDAVPLEEAYELMRKAAAEKFSVDHIDEPSTMVSLNVVLLENSDEYKGKGLFSKVYPGDTARFVHDEDKMDTTAEMTGYTWSPVQGEYMTVTFESSATTTSPITGPTISSVARQVTSIDRNVIVKAQDGIHQTEWSDKDPTDADPGVDGDVWYVQDGSAIAMWVHENGHWALKNDDVTGQKIQKKVDDAFAQIPVLEANIETAMQLAQDNAAKFADQDASIKAINDLVTGAKTDAANALLTAQTLQSDYTGIKQDIDTINGTLATVATQATVNGLTGDVQQLQATQKTQADQIVNMVTKTDLTTATNGLATESYVSGQIKVASDQISSTVTKVQNQLDNQTLGFRNLIPNSTFKLGQQGWTGWDTTSVHIQTETYHSKTYTAVFLGHLADGVVYKDLISTAKIPLKPSTAYTIRVLTRSIISNNNFIFTQEKSADDAVINDHAWKLDLKTADYQASIQHWTTSANADHATFRVRVNPNDEFMISEIMLVEGNTLPTDHIPAPEDSATVAALTSVSQTVDAIKVMATDNQNDLTALTVKVNGWQAAVTDQINDVKNTQTSLANQWTQEISATGSPNLIDGALWSDASTSNDNNAGGVNTGINLTKTTHGYYTGVQPLWVLNNKTTTENYAYSNRFSLKKNTVYAVSFLGFASSNVLSTDLWVLARPAGSTKAFEQAIEPIIGRKLSPAKAEYVYATFNSGDNTSAYLRFDNNGSSNGKSAGMYFTEVQVEEGSLATAFRPSTTVMAANIVEMQDLISANVTVAGKIAAQLSLSADGGGTALLAGNHVHITGATTIDSAVIKDSMIATMSANKITAGTIDASQVNVVNINASNITTGSITGANLSINLNTGKVEFQKGSISSTDGSLDINIDEGYIALTNNYDHSILIKDGQLQFTQPNIFDPTQGEPYMSISNDVVGNALHGASLLGRDYVAMSTNENMTSSLFGTDSIMGAQTFAGFGVGKNYKTVIGGATRGVFISGGQQIKNSDALQPSPSISIGSDAQGVNSGNRIVLKGEYVHAMAVQYQTTSGSANVFVANDGALVRVTSALKYKDQVERTYDDTIAERLITLPTATWIDKAERNRYNNDPVHQPVPERHFGMIAEDLAAAGIEELVVRGLDGELEGIEYDRIGPALVPLIKKLYDRVKKLEELQNEATA